MPQNISSPTKKVGAPNTPRAPARSVTDASAARASSSPPPRGFGPFLGAPDSSPFVIKVMMLLKLAGLDYREAQGNPLKAPKKLPPYIDDEGETVADSTFIRRHIERKYGFDFDAGLSAAQKAAAWAIEGMCEDHLYFAMLERRWLDRANFRKGVGTMFGIVPSPPESGRAAAEGRKCRPQTDVLRVPVLRNHRTPRRSF